MIKLCVIIIIDDSICWSKIMGSWTITLIKLFVKIPALGPTQPPNHWVPRALSRR